MRRSSPGRATWRFRAHRRSPYSYPRLGEFAAAVPASSNLGYPVPSVWFPASPSDAPRHKAPLNRYGQARLQKEPVRRWPGAAVLLLGVLLLAAPASLHAAPRAGSEAGAVLPAAGAAWPGEAPATDPPRGQGPASGAEGPIFQRFAAGRDASKTWQTMFEVPVALIPQTEPDAHIVANEGLNWVTAYQPLNRIYFGRSIGYARMVWQPGGRLDTTELVQWDWTEIVNIAVEPWWIVSIGAGVGFMDGLIFYKSGSFKHRLEVFLPVQVGTGLRLGKTWFAGAKLLQSSYFGPGPVASAARVLVGVGYNY